MLTQWKIIVPVTEPSFWKLSTQSSSSYTQHRVIIAQTQELSGKKEGSPALHKQSLQHSPTVCVFCSTSQDFENVLYNIMELKDLTSKIEIKMHKKDYF